jgi:succinoglycan biosynthesis protein ExoA
MPEPRIACSVLVPVFNEERFIESSAAAMRRQRFDGELEFIFADGGSTDRTPEILHRLAAQDPRIRVFANPAQTVSSGLNVALRHARGRWAVRMDAHTVYPDDYIALGVQRLARGGTRWVSGPQVPEGHSPISRAVALALVGSIGRGGSRRWGEAAAGDEDEYELDTGVFAGVWDRQTLLDYGGWDEHWDVNEDAEMAGRFLSNGERLVCVPAMSARYVPRDTLRGLWRQYHGWGEFRGRTARRHPASMRLSQLLPPVVVVSAIATVVAPRPVRRLARLGQLAYDASLLAAGARAWAAAHSRSDAALVPVVLFVMHAGYGVGQLRGWVKYGLPLAALAGLTGLEHPDSAWNPERDPVFAPSLHGGDPRPVA